VSIPIGWAVPQIIAFVLVVCRLSGLFLLAPVFSSPMIPSRLKLMALLTLAATLTPVVTATATHPLPTDTDHLALFVVKEILVGLSLGFAVAIVFSAVQVGASFIDTTMGFSMANIIDPLNNTSAAVFGSFYTMVATLSFLALNGHYWMIAGFVRSFRIVPIDSLPNFQVMLNNSLGVFYKLFFMAFEIAAPVIITLLLVDVVLGIVSRVVPQMNVFFVGIPLKVGVGMLAIIATMTGFTGFFASRVSDVMSGVSVLAGVTH
jgi:flagellar biosynthetic protein FliR